VIETRRKTGPLVIIYTRVDAATFSIMLNYVMLRPIVMAL